MIWATLIASLIIFIFGFVLFFGAPYLPTMSDQKKTALELLDLKPGQTMLELGSGDGRMLIAAAKKGIRAIGYEINPILFALSWLVTRRYKDLVTVRLANFWQQKLPDCDGIYVFLLNRYMAKLYKKITQEISNPVKLVSLAFKVPEVKHKTEKSGLYLYNINNS